MVHRTHKLTVLLVEDNPGDRMIERAYLTDFGFRQIYEAADGSKALLMLDKMNFDLIITDWKMPIVDGLNFFQKAKFDPHFKKIPIIFLTAITDRTEIEIAIEEGVTDYLVKPVNRVDLLNKIQKIFPDASLRSEKDDSSK